MVARESGRKAQRVRAPHAKGGSMGTELRECRDKAKEEKHTKNENMVKWEELRSWHTGCFDC